jgi:diguanylate cyclase (GGDEF)-like protein
MQNLGRLLRISTLKGRLRLWVGLLIVSMCLSFVLFMAFLVKVIKEREIYASLKETIELQRLFIDNWTSDRLADIEYLAAIPSAGELDAASVAEQYRLFASTRDEFDAVFYADAAGRVVTILEGVFRSDISNRDYFLEAKSGTVTVTDVIREPVTGKNVIVFAVPVRKRDGEFGGVAVGTVELATIDSIMSRFRFGNTGETFLLSKDGYRITKLRDEPDMPPMSERYDTEIVRRAAAGSQERSAYTNHEGVRVYGAYAWTDNHRWLLVGETRVADVYKPYYSLMSVMALITAIILLASYAAAMLLVRRVSALLGHLLHGTKRIREGEYGYRIDSSAIRSAPEELQELSSNFNIMSAKLQKTVQLLKESAVIDPLTDVYNRRFLINEAAKIEEAAARAGNALCVLLIDVDHFKQINDTYGHLVGDRVLKHAASLLVASVRSSDVVARYGGEEFVVLATNCDLDCGRELAERIRSWFISSPYRDEEREIAVTVSIGVSGSKPHRSPGAGAFEDMIKRADKALYRAKHRGRNRVEWDESDE